MSGSNVFWFFPFPDFCRIEWSPAVCAVVSQFGGAKLFIFCRRISKLPPPGRRRQLEFAVRAINIFGFHMVNN